MPSPFPSRQPAPSNWASGAKPKPTNSLNSDWRCRSCGKLLGRRLDGRLHLRFARGHEYLVGFPVQATCRRCKTLNECQFQDYRREPRS